jgi:hypothetical protein
MCWLCGFEGKRQVSKSWVFTRMIKRIVRSQKQVDAMFDEWVKQLLKALPNFRKNLAVDSNNLSNNFSNGLTNFGHHDHER